MTYDSESDRIILFGGVFLDPGVILQLLNDTWAYDANENVWIKMNPSNSPPAIAGGSFVYDKESDRSILFGGLEYKRDNNDTWVYDFNTNSWSKMNPTSSPAARIASASTYDIESDRMILYGGKAVGGFIHPTGMQRLRFYNDTWVYDYNESKWTQLFLSASPGEMEGHVLSYDSESDIALLFGGKNISSKGQIWNKESWALRYYPNRPTPPLTLETTIINSSVLLTWEPPISDGERPITNYNIYRRTNESEFLIIKRIGLVYEYVDTDVLSNTTYCYMITAINKIGESKDSIEVTITLPDITTSTYSNSSITIPGWILNTIVLTLITMVCINRLWQRLC